MPPEIRIRSHIDRIPQLESLSRAQREAMSAVAAVLPFRVNDYVLEQLIDWSSVPDDPIFQLTFPQEEMLSRADFRRMVKRVRGDAPTEEIRATARRIQGTLNPHPGGQLELNVPTLDGRPVPGLGPDLSRLLHLLLPLGPVCRK